MQTKWVRPYVAIISLCLGILCLARSLHAEDPRFEASDYQFLSTLWGHNPNAHPATDMNAWSGALYQAMERNPRTRPSALPQFARPTTLSESQLRALQRVEEVYFKYRSESPDSNWFRNTQLPKVIEEAAQSLRAAPAAEICPAPKAPTQTQELLTDITKAAATQEARATTQPAAPPSSSTWGPDAAAQYIANLKISELPAPQIRSRAENGLKPPGHDINQWKDGATINTIVLHHSAGTNQQGPAAIQQSHFNRGWADIGYHYLISPDGTIHEGREIKYSGAHVERQNADKIGIVFIGNFHPFHPERNPTGYSNVAEGTPTPAALQAAASLIRSIQSPNSDTQTRLRAVNVNVRVARIVGHRDCLSTDCPGDAAISSVRALNEKFFPTTAGGGQP